jgi:hypothetical protein
MIKDGKLSKSARLASTLIGIASAASTFVFMDDLEDPRLWTSAVLAIVFGYGAAWSGLSEQWGFNPFTHDPLGWRKAKKTYETPDDIDKSEGR